MTESPTSDQAIVSSNSDNALRQATPGLISLPNNMLQPDEQVEYTIRLHGAIEGIHTIRWLFTFDRPVCLQKQSGIAAFKAQMLIKYVCRATRTARSIRLATDRSYVSCRSLTSKLEPCLTVYKPGPWRYKCATKDLQSYCRSPV